MSKVQKIFQEERHLGHCNIKSVENISRRNNNNETPSQKAPDFFVLVWRYKYSRHLFCNLISDICIFQSASSQSAQPLRRLQSASSVTRLQIADMQLNTTKYWQGRKNENRVSGNYEYFTNSIKSSLMSQKSVIINKCISWLHSYKEPKDCQSPQGRIVWRFFTLKNPSFDFSFSC